jgi:PAS domain S-box-containing protein
MSTVNGSNRELELMFKKPPRDISFCTHAILNSEITIVEDALKDVRFRESPLVVGDPNIRFYAGAPLTTADGFNIGTLCVIDRVPRILTPTQASSLSVLARLVAAYVQSPQKRNRILAKALEESQINEISYRTIFENSPLGILQLNMKWEIVASNPAFQGLLGYSKEELRGKTILEVTHPEDLPRSLNELMSFDLVHRPKLKIKKRYLRKNGEAVWAEIVSKVVQFESGGEKFLFSTVEDVTAKIQRDEELKMERQKTIQAAKMASLGELSAGVAHEINNPLAIITMSLLSLDRSTDQSPKFKDNVAKVRRAVERIAKIVNGLKKFSRSSGQAQLEKKMLSSIVQNVMVMVEPKAKREGVSLSLELKTHGEILCDEIAIEQVIINLVNNAIDAVVDLPEKWVRLDVERDGERLALKVIDSGFGVPEALKEKLFQPFFTTKPVGQGTGLGLSVSKGILDQHEAHISISLEDQHTCFTVTFKEALKK